MPRILGVDIPDNKPTHIALRYVYGVGPALAARLCSEAGLDPQEAAGGLTDKDIKKLEAILERESTSVPLSSRRTARQALQDLKEGRTYHGRRRGVTIRQLRRLNAELNRAKDPMEAYNLRRKIRSAGRSIGLSDSEMVDEGLFRVLRRPVVKSKIGEAKIARAVREVIRNRRTFRP